MARSHYDNIDKFAKLIAEIRQLEYILPTWSKYTDYDMVVTLVPKGVYTGIVNGYTPESSDDDNEEPQDTQADKFIVLRGDNEKRQIHAYLNALLSADKRELEQLDNS